MKRRTYSDDMIRNVITLHFVHDKTYAQIADAIGMTRCAVAGLIHRNRWRAPK